MLANKTVGGKQAVDYFDDKIEDTFLLKEIKAAMLKPITDIQNKLDSLDSKQEMQNRAVLTLQRRSLLDSCERLLKQGYADLKDKEVIEKQFESYKELGGNSFVKELVVRVLNLPIENDTI